jgi:hypothetical protein
MIWRKRAHLNGELSFLTFQMVSQRLFVDRNLHK